MYRKYCFIKEVLDGISYRGYPLSMMAATDIIGFTYSYSKVRWLIKAAVRTLYVDNVKRYFSEKINGESVDTFYSISIPRPDYYRLVEAAMEKNRGHKCKLVDLTKKRRGPNLAFSAWLRSGFIIKSVSSKGNLSFYEKFALFLILVRTISQVRDIDNISMQSIPASYVAFNSSFGLEAYITQYFKNRGVNTYSLQHGMYTIYKYDIPLDAINYDNIVSDYMLCWGEYSRQQLLEYGISEERLLLAGNPLYSSYKREKVPSGFHKCIVYLARNKYDEGNRRLIQMLSECLPNIRFLIKLHPSLDMKKYDDLMNNENIELLGTTQTIAEIARSDLVDFVITYNTTVLYEFVRFGILCFSYTYHGDGSAVLEPFNSCEELKDGIERYKMFDVSAFDERLKSFSEYTIGTNRMHENYNI